MKFNVKGICFLGLGVALYVAMSLAIQVPVFENYYLCLGYVALAVYAYACGPIAGAIIGGMGCVLYCLVTSGMRGMPGWTLGNIFIGLALGFVFQKTRSWEAKNPRMKPMVVTAEAVVCVVGVVVGILLIKSYTEVVLYAQPMLVRMGKNIYATVADAVVLVVSLPICRILYKTMKTYFDANKGDNR